MVLVAAEKWMEEKVEKRQTSENDGELRFSKETLL